MTEETDLSDLVEGAFNAVGHSHSGWTHVFVSVNKIVNRPTQKHKYHICQKKSTCSKKKKIGHGNFFQTFETTESFNNIVTSVSATAGTCSADRMDAPLLIKYPSCRPFGAVFVVVADRLITDLEATALRTKVCCLAVGMRDSACGSTYVTFLVCPQPSGWSFSSGRWPRKLQAETGSSFVAGEGSSAVGRDW